MILGRTFYYRYLRPEGIIPVCLLLDLLVVDYSTCSLQVVPTRNGWHTGEPAVMLPYALKIAWFCFSLSGERQRKLSDATLRLD